MPNPAAARRATSWPIRPMPTMPSVRPPTSSPRSSTGCQPRHCPERTRRSPSPARRALISSSIMARSAVGAVTAPGVLVTAISASAAAARSIWFTPAPKFARIRQRGASTAENTSREKTSPSEGRMASYSVSASASSAGRVGPALSRIVRSNSTPARSWTAAGSGLVINRRGRIFSPPSCLPFGDPVPARSLHRFCRKD